MTEETNTTTIDEYVAKDDEDVSPQNQEENGEEENAEIAEPTDTLLQVFKTREKKVNITESEGHRVS